MKLKVNYVFSAEKFRLLMAYIFWFLIAAFVLISGWMVFDGMHMRSVKPELEKKLDTIKMKSISLSQPSDFPDEKKADILLSRIALINKLKLKRSCGTTGLLYKLESLVPAEINFTQFQYSYEDGLILIDAYASKASDIPGFIKALENDRLFKSVVLEKQAQKEIGTGDQKTFFTITTEEAR